MGALPIFPEPDARRILRLDGGGPTARVTAMAFSPDGRRLYAAGYDKVVRFWEWDATGKKVELVHI